MSADIQSWRCALALKRRTLFMLVKWLRIVDPFFSKDKLLSSVRV
jgi:hypothetical protein